MNDGYEFPTSDRDPHPNPQAADLAAELDRFAFHKAAIILRLLAEKATRIRWITNTIETIERTEISTMLGTALIRLNKYNHLEVRVGDDERVLKVFDHAMLGDLKLKAERAIRAAYIWQQMGGDDGGNLDKMTEALGGL